MNLEEHGRRLAEAVLEDRAHFDHSRAFPFFAGDKIKLHYIGFDGQQHTRGGTYIRHDRDWFIVERLEMGTQRRIAIPMNRVLEVSA